MPLVVNWNGEPIQPQEPTKERTTIGGSFTSGKNIATYYPVAPAYSSLLQTIDFYKVPEHFADRPCLIANELYKSADYWWVIFWSNSIVDPFGRPAAGEIIRVISIEDMNRLLRS